ncbi:adhesion G protein-coupled receptor L3-like isoform X1 [Dreissena polymorpha]|uniref:adhesion G protein-coupled receptor L3-like isoform X1 n=1 Tax=Dreissena polymorpha TaxID=45954 RepID=UPI0022642288|nr:adhesion G protein-coupled receptor L3-like isoform X1 [Dreissena polymorpha]
MYKGQFLSNSEFQKGLEKVWMNTFECMGAELSIENCTNWSVSDDYIDYNIDCNFHVGVVCNPKDCPSQQKIENGKLVTDGSTSYGSIARVICDTGFRVSSNLTNGGVKCFPHGEWETVYCERNSKLIFVTNDQKAVSPKTNLAPVQCLSNTDFKGVQWPTVDAGNATRKNCTDGYSGIITRSCSASGYYEKPVYNCTTQAISALFNKVKDNMSVNIKETIDDLRKEIRISSEDNNTNSGDKTALRVGDIETATEILKLITDRFEANTSATENVTDVTDSFVDVVANLISNRTTHSWGALLDKGGAATVINVLDNFISKVVYTSAVSKQNLTVRKESIFLEIGSVEQCSKIKFPNSEKNGNVPEWALTRHDTVEVACRGSGGLTFSGSLFRNITSIMSSKTKDSRHMEINAPVLAFSVHDSTTASGAQNVTLVFELFNTDLSKPSCSFWEKGNSSVEGFWSSDGCELVEYNQQTGRVTCSCNHLTNFAVLMSPGVTVEKIHHQALSAITVVGCCLSLAGLVTTSVIYVYCWRMVKSNRATLLLNLCVALLVAYLAFLIGIKRTQPMGACTFTAVLLHYVYLVAFFLMLAEAGVIALMVLSPLTKTDSVPYFLAGAYGIPVVIVGVSMVVTQLDGYGNERFCWLSVESGLFWAFAGLVLAIVVTNLIILVLVLKQLFGVAAMSKKTDAEKVKTGVRSVCILLPVLGLTWVFGIFAVNKDTLVFQYLFAIFNSLQGFLIFLVQCVFDRKVRDALRQRKLPWFTSTDVRTGDTEMRSTQKST